jgi:hypothetical protein
MRKLQFAPSTCAPWFRYHYPMQIHKNNKPLPPELERYIALCQRIYERMEAEGSWPWTDSTDRQDLLESKDKPHEL